MMLSLDTAYRSFGGEVEASSTPTICRLSDSRRHQLWAIAQESISLPFAEQDCGRCSPLFPTEPRSKPKGEGRLVSDYRSEGPQTDRNTVERSSETECPA